MISVEEALMTRLTGDTSGTGNLQTLLGGSGRIFHAMESRFPIAGSITYMNTTSVPGGVRSKDVDTRVEYYNFNIYHKQYETVKERIKLLLHYYRFPTPTDAGIKACTWDWEGPDEFDEDLKIGLKRVRYKLEVVPSAQAPI